MPMLVQYTCEVETWVVVLADGLPVGEYVVRSEPPHKMFSDGPRAIPTLVEQAMVKNAKAAKTMAAGVENTERTRLR